MDSLGMEQIYKFLKESLEGRQFSGEFNMIVEQGTLQEKYIIIIDKSEIELKANLHAANKLLHIFPKVQSGIITESNKNEKSLTICVTLTSKNDIPTFGRHLWTLDKVSYNGKDLGGVFTYFVTRLNPPAFIGNNFDWQVFYLSVKEFFRYLTFFAVILIYALTEFMKHLYLLMYKFLDILPRLVDNFMPLFLAIVNAITKVVGGFYLLMVMVWNGHPPGQNPQARGFAPRKLENQRAFPQIQPGPYSTTFRNIDKKPINNLNSF